MKIRKSIGAKTVRRVFVCSGRRKSVIDFMCFAQFGNLFGRVGWSQPRDKIPYVEAWQTNERSTLGRQRHTRCCATYSFLIST